MLVEISRSDLSKKNPVEGVLARILDIPEKYIIYRQKVIIFLGYDMSIVHHHFNCKKLEKFWKGYIKGAGTNPNPFSFRIFENDLYGDFSSDIWWEYTKAYGTDYETKEGPEAV